MSTAGAKLTSGPRSDDTSSRSAALDLVPFVCAIAALASILFVSVALGTHEWIQGTVLRDGKPIEAFVGLGSVRMAGETSSFGKLCPAGTKLTIPAHFETTPAGVWCKCKLAGTSGGWLLWLAYLPMWAACILSAIEGLATVVAQAKGAKARLAGMGLSQRLQGFVLIGCWVVSWLFLFLGLLAYSAAAPDTLGWGAVHFEASFGLARLAFLLVTVCTGVIIAKTLRLWQEESFGEALGDFVESRGVRRIVYIVLGVQLLLFMLASVATIEWQALVPLIALYYLDTDKPNLLVLYVTLTAMSLLFDLMRLTCNPRWTYMDVKDEFSEAVYLVIFLSKFVVLGLLGFLKREELKATRFPPTSDGREPEIAE